VVLEDGYKTQPAEVSVDSLHGKGAWLRVIMREGRKRQIREIGGLLGLPVVRIVRVRIGSLRLGTLKPKEWRTLSDEEIAHLKGEKPARPPRQTRRPTVSRSEQGTFKKKSGPSKSGPGESRREQKPGPARRKPSRPPR
jgi:23S rRNA pseudouridine2605 synthase